MSCFSVNSEAKIKLKKIVINRQKINKSEYHNKLNLKKLNNNLHISNLAKKIVVNSYNSSKNLNGNTLSDNFSPSNKLSNDSTNKSKLRKIKNASSLILDRYSNAVLFKNRISKNTNYLFRNKPYLCNDKLLISKLKSIDVFSYRNKLVVNKNENGLKNQICTPTEKKKIFNYNKKNEKFCKSHSYQGKIDNSHSSSKSNNKTEYNHKMNKIRANSAICLPQINTITIDKYITLSDKEKEKIKINTNLKGFLDKIKNKIKPTKKIILTKFPSSINNKMNDSCIHKLEYGNSYIFVKTHLDGFFEKGENKSNTMRKLRKYEINEGYIDLDVLNYGNDISFKTNLIVKNGLYYYEFGKNGRMEKVEKKVHKIRKDKKGFKQLLEKYNQNQINQYKENKDFKMNTIKKIEACPVINNNIFKDLYHMLIKNNK